MSEEDINIIEDFLNYNKEKYLSGVEISSISQLLEAYKKQQKEIERKNKLIEKNRIALENCLKYRSEENYE